MEYEKIGSLYILGQFSMQIHANGGSNVVGGGHFVPEKKNFFFYLQMLLSICLLTMFYCNLLQMLRSLFLMNATCKMRCIFYRLNFFQHSMLLTTNHTALHLFKKQKKIT